MLQILIHSSKTMRTPSHPVTPLAAPQLITHAEKIMSALQHQSVTAIAKQMNVSPKKAIEVTAIHKQWSVNPKMQSPAVDTFVGDIYSGLQVVSWSAKDRTYAQKHLLVLSGLYGGLRPFDGIQPYRMEMGYKLPDGSSLYIFWSDSIAQLLPPSTTLIINLSAVEYTKAILPYTQARVVTPKFLTLNTAGKPTFVTVHTKIARGAFANWLITQRISRDEQLKLFSDLGYKFDASLSSPDEPVFVCKQFGGIGLSVRLNNS